MNAKSKIQSLITAANAKTGKSDTDLTAAVQSLIDVPTGEARDSSDLTVSGATVNVPAGLYSSAASKSVASGTAGTPTVSKGAVSNNSMTVTPSVVNTTGYITGGTKTGPGVTVSASELVSGNKALTPSETAQSDIDVTNFKTASVGAISSTYVGSGVSKKAAATVAPSTSEQIVCASGVYTTGEQKVSAITPSIVGNLDASSFATSIVAAIESKGVTVPDGAKLDGMAAAIGAITTADNIVHADIPDYIKAAALEVAKKVRAVQTGESITFIAMSDSHQLDTSADIITGNLHAGMAAKVLAYALPNIDFMCFLGDYTAGSSTTTIDEGKQHFAEINADIDEAFSGIPQFRTLGNHDSLKYSEAQNGTALTPAELFELVGKYNDGATYGSTTDGYCYRDFTDKKVRVICLNTADNGQKENLSDTQKLWFANTLKSAGAKGSDWGIIVLSHHPLDWGNVLMASNIVHAYVEGTSITVSSGNTVDFSGSNSAKFLGAFHGHVHCFKAAKLNYIANSVGTEYQAYRIAVPNMCFSRNNEYGQNGNAEYYGIEFGEDTTYNKTAGTANDTAFVVNVVNPSEEKIYSFCYGAGYDREIFTGTVIIPTTGITLDQTSGTLTEGDTVTLTATVSPDNATYKSVTWETSNSAVATVVDGVVTALRAGTAIITAKTADSNFSATYTLTVEAVQVNYTNLVPTAQEVGSTEPYNGTGYCDGKYLSTGASPWEGTDSACVLTGNIPYVISSTGLPKTIYIKGAAWEAISHCRMCFFVENKNSICGPGITGNGSGNSALSKYFTVETLGDKYIKLTPIASASGTNSMLVSTVASAANARFVRFSLKGTGANLIITLDEPIE